MINKKYKQVISLGSFCSVALEIERIGVREGSYPFDWLITNDFDKVIELIQSRFEGFLDITDLLQEEDKNHFYSRRNHLHFYHDFKNSETPLEYQFALVTQKYNRRIERFFTSISQPTLFIRYLSSSDTADSIYRGVVFLKKICPESHIIFIKNGSYNSFDGNIATVIPDEGDTVSRKF